MAQSRSGIETSRDLLVKHALRANGMRIESAFPFENFLENSLESTQAFIFVQPTN